MNSATPFLIAGMAFGSVAISVVIYARLMIMAEQKSIKNTKAVRPQSVHVNQ